MNTKPYKIAINTRALMKGKLDGIGWFTYHILKHWVENHPEHEFYFIFDRAYDESFIFGKNVIPIITYPPARHPMLWWIWYEISVPRILNQIKPDVFVSFDTYTSIAWKGKKITGIHDIAFALFDGQLGRLPQWFLRHFTPKYIQTSDKIVTVSESTRRDLARVYDCDISKVVVAHNAPADVYNPMSIDDQTEFKLQHTDGKDYFIFVGTIHPRKNLISLLKAFELFKSKHPSDKKLVVIGKFSWKYEEESQYLEQMNSRQDIILLPHSSPEKIAKWMASSIALVMTSHYEGFGIPLVEAMASGVPIICSNVSSMPEVVANSAILITPTDIEEISKALHLISYDESLRSQLILKGQIRVKNYTWDSSAEMIWEELERMVNEGKQSD